MSEFSAESVKWYLERHGAVGIMTSLKEAGVDESYVKDVAVHVRAMLYITHANLAFAERRRVAGPVHVMSLHSSDYAGIPSAYRPEDLSPVASAVVRILKDAGATLDLLAVGGRAGDYDLVIMRY
jgi:hypothetical protein